MPTEYSTSTKAKSYDEAYCKGLSESAKEPDNPRDLDVIRLAS